MIKRLYLLVNVQIDNEAKVKSIKNTNKKPCNNFISK